MWAVGRSRWRCGTSTMLEIRAHLKAVERFVGCLAGGKGSRETVGDQLSVVSRAREMEKSQFGENERAYPWVDRICLCCSRVES